MAEFVHQAKQVKMLSLELEKRKGKAALDRVRKQEGYVGKNRIKMLRSAIGMPSETKPATTSQTTKPATSKPEAPGVTVRNRVGESISASRFRDMTEEQRHDWLAGRQRPKKITREEFRQLTARERADFCRAGGKLID